MLSPCIVFFVTNYRYFGYVKYLFINNTQLLNLTTVATSSPSNNEYSIYLFRLNGDYIQPINAVLYSCKLYDGSTLIRDFIPAVRLSDGEAGLYDVVNDVFYTNAGTGKFTYGEFKNIPDGYAKVDLGTMNGGTDTGMFYFNAYGYNASGNFFVSNNYDKVTTFTTLLATNKAVYGLNNENKIFFHDNDYANFEAFKTAMSGVWLLYELA